MNRLIIFLILTLPIHAFANGVEEKTRKLFEVQGVLSYYQEWIDQSRTQEKEESKQVIDQMLAQFNPSKEFKDRFSKAGDKFIKALQTDRTAEQIIEVMIQYHASKFTEQELDGLIAFYSSDLGKKDVAVGKDANQFISQYYKAENDRIRTTATNDFVKDLQLIAMQCNCTKQPALKKKK